MLRGETLVSVTRTLVRLARVAFLLPPRLQVLMMALVQYNEHDDANYAVHGTIRADDATNDPADGG